MIDFIHIPKNAGTVIRDSILHSNVQYQYHSFDVMSGTNDQLIIIRDPIDRFNSAVFYAFTYYSHEPQIKNLIEKGISTPNTFADAMFNKHHPCYIDVMDEVLNKKLEHKIGDKPLEYKFTYTPQHYWIYKPKYIILFENLDQEFAFFTSNVLKTDSISNIKKSNASTRSEVPLSYNNILNLLDFYEQDVVLYNYYKNLNIIDRLYLP